MCLRSFPADAFVISSVATDFGRAGCFAAIGGAEELHQFGHDAEFLFLLAGGFVVPLVQLQPALDKHGATFAEVLAHVFRRAPEHIHIHKRHFFLLLARFRFPFAIDGDSEFSDGCAFGRVAQFRIAS